MSNYQEGIAVMCICFGVFGCSLGGVAIYYLSEVRKEMRQERFKMNVLIESMIEIFESKYNLYDNKDESNGIPRRE